MLCRVWAAPSREAKPRWMQRESGASPLPRCVVPQHTSCGKPYRTRQQTIVNGRVNLECLEHEPQANLSQALLPSDSDI